RHLDESVGAFLIEPLCPRADRDGGNEKVLCALCQRPTSRGSQLEDPESLDWRVVWTPVGGYLLHPRVLDPALLAKEKDFVSEALVLRFEADAGVEVVGSPAPGVGHGGPRQGDGVDDGRADAAGPAL